MKSRLRLWFERKVEGLHHYLQAPKRPKLAPGDQLEVKFSDPRLINPWVRHTFVDWGDIPVICPSCGHRVVRPRMVVESCDGKKLLIVVSYGEDRAVTPPWRPVPKHPWWSLVRRSCTPPSQS